jgi:hypothetical protein
MVALVENPAPTKRPSPAKNRAPDFFAAPPDRAGVSGFPTRTHAGKNDRFSYDARRSVSLAQKGETSQWTHETTSGTFVSHTKEGNRTTVEHTHEYEWEIRWRIVDGDRLEWETVSFTGNKLGDIDQSIGIGVNFVGGVSFWKNDTTTLEKFGGTTRGLEGTVFANIVGRRELHTGFSVGLGPFGVGLPYSVKDIQWEYKIRVEIPIGISKPRD